jgi:hypothetical protein
MNLSRLFAIAAVCLLAVATDGAASAQDWKPAQGPLMTRWAKDVSPENVHAEYPRPQLVREQWQNLNGLWEYALADGEAAAPPAKYDGQILVPFPIESALSGVMKRVGPGQRLWYRRNFVAPKHAADGKVLLHFGAVDWQSVAYVNGKEVGRHQGGYDPFTFDITAALDANKEQQELIVAVIDPTDANWQPRGKQVGRPHGIWYTPTSGIWQTVWLEPVAKSHVERLQIVPNIDDESVEITVNVAGDAKDVQLTVLDGDKSVKLSMGAAGKKQTVKLENPKLWSPDSPFLYGLKVEVLHDGQIVDTVDSYFGMRKISLGKDDRGITRVMLNNEFVFQYGPLDQGFWPDGLYTAPSDAALKYDLEVTKQLGFNMIRKHVKVEPARWYHHCDQLGILVWQDMPSGDRYIGSNDPDIERSAESAKNFEHEWSEIIRDFGNSPAIVIWVPFNEGWGQFDTARITELTRQLDPSRLVNSTSGWADRKVGDVHDIHVYPGPGAPEVEEKRAIVLGEFGGLGLPLEGHTWQGKDNWGYRSFESKAALNAAYEQLIVKLRPLIYQGLSAAVYTQTTDVEVEVNGFMTYDREVLKFDKDRVAALHRKLYLPPPKVEVVLATSQKEAADWRYTLEKPADGWNKPDFDDAGWKTGPAGFGEASTPGSVVRTNWKTNDIWLRRTVKLEQHSFEGLHLLMHHDEDTEVYFNGVLAAKTTGWTTDYSLIAIDPQAIAALKPGENVIAVHTLQKTGGQYIDLGLVRIVEQK